MLSLCCGLGGSRQGFRFRENNNDNDSNDDDDGDDNHNDAGALTFLLDGIIYKPRQNFPPGPAKEGWCHFNVTQGL